MWAKQILISIIIVMAVSACSNKEATLLIDSKSGVGEGALWDVETQQLYWIDISGKLLHVYNPEDKTLNTHTLPFEIGTVVVIDKDKVLLALAPALYEYSLSTKVLTKKSGIIFDTTQVRFNDGKCSPDGRLWVGTMDKGVSKPIASLYMIDKDFSPMEKEHGITVSNGIIWSLDGKKMYYIDSPTYTVVAYDYDKTTGSIANKKTIINTPKVWGTPDGSTIDAEGMLWVAHWGGGIISRWNPSNGELLDSIMVASPNVTSVAFGGKDLDNLYITTAKNWMKEGDEQKYPEAGGLFIAKPGVKGVPSTRFKIK